MQCQSVYEKSPFSYPALPAELFPIITSFIPLFFAPSTILSLALGNHGFFRIVLPLLYERLVLKNEDDALAVFHKILEQPNLALAVRELYVLSGLSLSTRKGEKAFDVVTGLRKIVERGLLPRLSTLGIYLARSWYNESRPDADASRGHLPTRFWKDLYNNCPRLREIILRNIGDRETTEHHWIDKSIAEDINMFTELSTLSLQFWMSGVSNPTASKMLANILQLASSLERLTLGIQLDYQHAKSIMCHHFPSLKSIRLMSFTTYNEVAVPMAFWRQHPQLEHISLIGCLRRWFSTEVEASLLPNLRHLKAGFENVRALAPILHRLQSLSIMDSFNAQIPYLVRVVLPNGLPSLKSLEIVQQGHSGSPREMRRLEGSLWYEKPDGTFCVAKPQKAYRTMEEYMHSIVKAVPSVEELGLHYGGLTGDNLPTLVPLLADLPSLERLYCGGFSLTNEVSLAPVNVDDRVSQFLAAATTVANVCHRLTMVTSPTERNLPYLAAKIERDSAGTIRNVRRIAGVGLLIPEGEHEPFPFTGRFA